MLRGGGKGYVKSLHRLPSVSLLLTWEWGRLEGVLSNGTLLEIIMFTVNARRHAFIDQPVRWFSKSERRNGQKRLVSVVSIWYDILSGRKRHYECCEINISHLLVLNLVFWLYCSSVYKIRDGPQDGPQGWSMDRGSMFCIRPIRKHSKQFVQTKNL